MITQAEGAIDAASLAAEPGSQEETELNAARQSLADAKGDYEKGGFFNRGGYREAENEAREADQAASAITDRVAGLLKEARSQMSSNALAVASYSKAFDLNRRYPRTPEAVEALSMSEDNFVASMLYTASLTNAVEFTAAFPGKSDRIVGKAKGLLTSLSDSQLSSLSAGLKKNQDDVAAMNTGGRASGSGWSGNDPQDTAELRQALSAAQAPTLYQSAEMQRLISILGDASAMSEEIMGMKPVQSRTSGTTTTSTYSQGQIDRVAQINAAMAPMLNEAQALLNTVKAQ